MSSRRRSIAVTVIVTVALALLHAHTALGFTQPMTTQSSRAPSPLSMAKGRRGGLDAGGSSGGSKPRPLGGNNENASESTAPNKKGKWSPVSGLPSLKSLPQEQSAVKLVDTLVPSLINKQTNPTGAVSVVNYGETTYCFSAGCASCKVPLTKAKVLDPNEETVKDARLQCDFCGATYNLRTGAPVAREGGKLLGFLFSKQETETLPVYALGEQGGKVFINVP